MPFDGIEAARADVRYETNLGQFRAEQEQVQAVYSRTTATMTDEALKLAVAQERLNRTIAQQGPESYAAARATVAYRATLGELAATETAAAAASQRAARQRLAAYTGAARTIGTTLTRYVAAPTALAAAAAVKLAFDFEGSMRLIQTQAGATAGEVNSASDSILKLVRSGDSFGQTANDMAKALFPIESEGIHGAKALEILRVAAAGAAVGQTDLAQTANALTSAMRVYDVEAGGAAKTQATLNAIVGAGKLHMEDLVAALSTKYLPVAKQLGIPLDQAGAALDVFTRAGIPAESAATNLTTALLKILNPSKSAGSNLEQLGLNSTQLAQELQQGGLTSAIGTLAKGYDQLVASQGKVAANQAVVGAFGGVKGGSSVLTLIQQYDQYLKGLDQIQQKANPGEFWKNVAVTMHEPANQVHQDIARISGDLILVGEKLAPLVADITGFGADVVDGIGKLDEPAKVAAVALLGIVAVGGPLVVMAGGVVRGFEAIGRASAAISGGTTSAVLTADEQLAILRANAAETAAALEAAGAEGGAGLAAGIGAGVAKAEGELAGLGAAEAGAGASGLLGRVGGLTGLRAVGAYGLGGLVAGNVVKGVVPGEAGQAVGNAAEYAGLGAVLGSFVGPEGTAIGAGIGAIVGGVTSLIHSGPSFVQQLDAMGQSLSRFHEAASANAHAITQLRVQIPNDRVARDQAEQELAAATAEEKATRGTNRHAAAVDRLRAAQANLAAATRQISTDTAALARQEGEHRINLQRIAQQEAANVKTLTALGTSANNSLEVTLHQATATEEYVKQLNSLADSAQSSDPKLAAVARKLVRITENVHRIPSEKTVRIVVNEVYHPDPRTHGIAAGVFGGVAAAAAAIEAAAKAAANKAGKGLHGTDTTFTARIPVRLQIDLQRAENAGDVAAQRKYLNDEKAFLEAELQKARKAGNKRHELDALQAIGAVDSQLSTLTSTTTKAGKTRHQRYLEHVRAEQGKLEINLARARLAEQKAGENKTLLDRAEKAERRALQDEINFYRREARDHELSLAERQRYAKRAIAAEQAKLKIGKQTVQQTVALKQAEAEVLADLQTILHNYAGNFFSTSTKPDVQVHVHQSFPSEPTDHHRQARGALLAMRNAFDS